MKKHKKQGEFLEQLRKIPIILVASEKSGLSRNTIYRWRREDEQFSKDMDAALVEGEALVNDMSESQLLTLIKEKNWSAISFWLRHRNPKFKDRVEVTTKLGHDGKLTPEQEIIVREALRLASFNATTITNSQDTEYGTQHDDSTRSGGDNDQG